MKVSKVSIKDGDKLYLVTREDLSPGYQAVQACHALRQFVADHPEIDKEWFTQSNYLALLVVKNLDDLVKLQNDAQNLGLRVSVFDEPDIDNQITAIAIEPHPKSQELCRSLSLALKIQR